MQLTESDNQAYFDRNKAREADCALWLKGLSKNKSVRKPVLSAALAGIANGLAVIAQSAVLAYILQAVIIDNAALDSLVISFALLAGLILFRGLCVYIQQSLGFEAGAEVRSSVRRQLSEHLLLLGPAAIKHRHSGELTSLALEQIDALEPYFSRYLPQQIIVGVLPILTIILLIPVNWVVGLIFLTTGPLTPLFMALIGMGAASANRSQFLALARMSGYFLDRLQGLETLKQFGQAVRELENINRIADDFRQKTMAVLRIAFLSSAVLEFFAAVSIALVAVYVGFGLLGQIRFGPAEQISLQEALFVLLLAPEFFAPLRQLALFYHDRAAALGAADSLLALLEQTPEQAPNNDMITGSDKAVEFRKVDKYYGHRQVLFDINLDIAHSEKIALIGESGAGKTTLINLLLGFENASAGSVLLNGLPVSRERAAETIAWVGQKAYLFHGNIKANIALTEPDASEIRLAEAARAAGVTEFTEAWAEGLLTPVGERGHGLSGGQLQRVALARAFLKNTEIVLLDEPTANLDTDNKMLLLNVIEQLFKNKTLIIATHDPEVIRRMDRSIMLKQGRLSE